MERYPIQGVAMTGIVTMLSRCTVQYVCTYHCMHALDFPFLNQTSLLCLTHFIDISSTVGLVSGIDVCARPQVGIDTIRVLYLFLVFIGMPREAAPCVNKGLVGSQSNSGLGTFVLHSWYAEQATLAELDASCCPGQRLYLPRSHAQCLAFTQIAAYVRNRS